MLTDTFHDLFEGCRHKHAVVVKNIARAFLLFIKILENLVELLRYFIQAGVARSDFLDIVSEQLILDKRERQNATRPAILHLDVFAALLLNHHIWIDFTYGLPAFGLNNLKVAGNARPYIIKSLVGIVAVNKHDAGKGIVKLRCNMLFFSHSVDLQCTVHPMGTLGTYTFVVVCSRYDGKWLLSRHRERDTWETQGGHIEPGETPMQAARRELYEESGVRDAELYPVCDYRGFDSQSSANGMVFFAAVRRLEPLPESEIGEVRLFSALPENLTYPNVTPRLMAEAQRNIGGCNMTTEELRNSLLASPKNGYTRLTDAQRDEMEGYAQRYMAFMSECKTEREATAWAVREAEKLGYKPFAPGMEAKPGDKIYYNNRNKSIALAVVGTKSLGEGANICAAHVDSPRLDIKPNPLYEDSEISYLKTHYYGGIKKYQWTTIPLALHGVVYRADGAVVTVTIGEDEGDPILMVSDLLPHLAADQMQKPAGKIIEGEQLNVILGSEPLEGDGSDLVKLHIMKLLNEKYGLVESDFLSAELTVVPAGRCREAGLDRSLLSSYGHDDRVCAYAELEALFSLDMPEKTAVCILADKEEIGSVGISGMQSHYFEHFMEGLCDAQGVKLSDCFANSFCLSADVSNAFDPNWPETCDKRNNSQLNYGVAICKYTGSRGKGGASDASAEAMGHVRSTLDKAGVIWQIATLGKVDQGGGGTVAAYMANRNIVTVDAGVPVLSMHAPLELVSKLDCYETMLACKAIYLA
ncbi:MAG: aminopeptidase [Slackia sp.]|nr:aminopeptidase [Slackia sp.]